MLSERGRRRFVLTVGLVCLVGLSAVVAWWYLTERWVSNHQPPILEDVRQSAVVDPTMASRIVRFCGNCHAMPLPDSFPRDAWHDRVMRGYEFYALSGMTHLDPPPINATVQYYRSRAPEQLVFPEVPEAAQPLGTTFRAETYEHTAAVDVPPAIAHVRWARLDPSDVPMLITCDMRRGTVAATDLRDGGRSVHVLASLRHPCHVEVSDLDSDGRLDLLVADLGSTVPYDHELGRVVWLRARETYTDYEEIVLASGLGRVVDVRPGDLDGDGDLDMVVAVFGHRRTGQIIYLQNVAESDEFPKFALRRVDPRPGAIHVPVLDLNQDGRLDFLSLISQEYECVEACLNQGNDVFGRPIFHHWRIWSAPDLTFGSSGIEPVDLDGDGDTDILYTNGDAFDNNYASPWHGVQWLENLGNNSFRYHRLTHLAGAYRALAGDVDNDGDLDVVAVAWLPDEVRPSSLRSPDQPSVICLEQTSPGVFERHTLERGTPNHATLELADFDGDGDVDLAVAWHLARATQQPPWLTIWWNDLPPKK